MSDEGERFDEYGFPTESFSEVVPGLLQADASFSPIQLFHHGFDAVFDLCGLDRGDGVVEAVFEGERRPP